MKTMCWLDNLWLLAYLHGNRFHVLSSVHLFFFFLPLFENELISHCSQFRLLYYFFLGEKLFRVRCAISRQQAGYVRGTVSVIQRAYSALLYIQETTSCRGCCTVHRGQNRKWKKKKKHSEWSLLCMFTTLCGRQCLKRNLAAKEKWTCPSVAQRPVELLHVSKGSLLSLRAAVLIFWLPQISDKRFLYHDLFLQHPTLLHLTITSYMSFTISIFIWFSSYNLHQTLVTVQHWHNVFIVLIRINRKLRDIEIIFCISCDIWAILT